MNASRSFSDAPIEARPGACPTSTTWPGSDGPSDAVAWLGAVDDIVRAVSDDAPRADGVPVADLAGLLAAVADHATARLPGRRVVFVPQHALDTAEPAPHVCGPVAAEVGADRTGHLHLFLADGIRATGADLAAVHVLVRSAVDLAAQHARDARWHEKVRRLEADAERARRKADQLTAALLSSRDISTAIGIMMASDKLTADDAFGWLRSVSQDDNRTLRDVALDVVHTGVLPAVTRPSRRPE